MTTYTGLLGKRTLVSYVDPCPGKTSSDYGVGPCSRCGGTGAFGPYCVFNGRCFQCGGNGSMNITVATLRKHARKAAYFADFAEEIAEFVAVRNWLQAEIWFHASQAELAAEKAAEEARLAALVQGFLAEVGEKVTGIDITVKVAKYISGSYNRSSGMFIIAETATGQVVKFFGSAASVMRLQRGDAVTILTAKVKGHESYNGQDQTQLSHVKVTEVEEAAA